MPQSPSEQTQLMLIAGRAGLELQDALDVAGLSLADYESQPALQTQYEDARRQEGRSKLMAEAVMRSFVGAAGPAAARQFLYYLDGEKAMEQAKELTSGT